MRKHVGTEEGEGRSCALPEVRAGLVFVKPQGSFGNDAGGRWTRRGKTWLLPLMRVVALAASMLCITPTGGMGTGMANIDAWGGGGFESESHEDSRPHRGQRQEHVVFVGVPEESAVLPLKALAQEMMARGYRASLALPHGFQSWVEDVPGLAFVSLEGASVYRSSTSCDAMMQSSTNTLAVDQSQGAPHAFDPMAACPSCPHGSGRKACSGEGLGDGWGGGVGGGWGGGLGLWRGLWGSLVGAREFLGHLKAYLGFYRREEAAMYAPLVEALRRDPPALVVADRRALAAFRACFELGLRCVVNSAGLLGDLDRPPSSIPAPYSGFPVEGQTIGQRLHNSLLRLVLALSRLQAARDADDLAGWRDESPLFSSSQGQDYPSSTVMALGNSCFGSLEHARTLSSRVHMVGPLWMSSWDEGEDAGTAPPGLCDARPAASGGGSGGDSASPSWGRGGGKERVLEDVWAWLEPEGVKEEEVLPVVVMQLGYGGGKAWGVSPDAAVGGVEDGSGVRPSWKAFREETASQLSVVGCRTLWLDHGEHPDPLDENASQAENRNPGNVSDGPSTREPSGERSLPRRKAPPLKDHGEDAGKRAVTPGGEGRGKTPDDGIAGLGEGQERWRDDPWLPLVLDVRQACGVGVVGCSELLLGVMAHRSVTVLVTDGDVRSLQAALWSGKPSVVLPTSPDQREAAYRLVHSGAGVLCSPPCEPTALTAAIVDAHGDGKRRAALRSSVVLREAGGVGKAASLLENELLTHKAATARRNGCPYVSGLARGGDDDVELPAWCETEDRREEPREERDKERRPRESGSFLLEAAPEGLSWYPDDAEWVGRDMSWAQRNLMDVYAVYGAVVMGVGLLMKLTWNLVWSLCDISTAPTLARGGAGSMDNLSSPSSSPPKEPGKANGGDGGAGCTSGKPGRGGGGKWGGGGGGKDGRGGGGRGGKHHCNNSNSNACIVHHAGAVPPPTGGKYPKKMALTNGHS